MPAQNRPIAYLVNQYPGVSHSFIRREIAALEALGQSVERFSVRGWDAALGDPADIAEREQTRYLLKGGMGALVGAVLRRALRHPGRVLAATRLALSMSRNAVRSWPYHLVYLAEACRLVDWLEQSGARHLHAHFGTNAAEVACLSQALGGPPFSFTSHGPAEADDGARLHLPEKVGRAAFVAAISSHTKSLILRRVPQTMWHKVHTIHCGLTERAFAEAAPEPDVPTFLFVGRLVPQKAPGLLLEAFADLHQRYPDARLVLAGDGEMRATLETRIAALGLGEAVHITGWIGSDQVRAEIDRATVFVLPSFNEGLPVVIMEALARGRPVISTYIAGIPELVTPDLGWLVPAGDVDALGQAMETALAVGTERRAEMGRSGREAVRAQHLARAEAEKLASLIEAPQPSMS